MHGRRATCRQVDARRHSTSFCLHYCIARLQDVYREFVHLQRGHIQVGQWSTANELRLVGIFG